MKRARDENSEDDESTVELVLFQPSSSKRARATDVIVIGDDEGDEDEGEAEGEGDEPPLEREWRVLLRDLRGRRFTANVNERHPCARDLRIVLHEEGHRYQVDGTPGRFTSVTDAMELLDKPFNGTYAARGVARKAMNAAGTAASTTPTPTPTATSTPVLRAPPPSVEQLAHEAAVRTEWNTRRDVGTRRHAFYERFILGDPTLTDDEVRAEVPLAFLRFWRDHPTLVPWRTEWRIFDERVRVSGTLDLLCTGGILVDWKNYEPESLFPERERARLEALGFGLPPGVKGNAGTRKPAPMAHPRAAHLPTVKIAKAALQLNFYRHLIATRYADVYPTPITQLWIVTTSQLAGHDDYHVYRMPVLDVAPLFELFPWREQDVRHLVSPDEEARLQLDYIAPDDDPDDDFVPPETPDADDPASSSSSSDATWDPHQREWPDASDDDKQEAEAVEEEEEEEEDPHPGRTRVVGLDTQALGIFADPAYVWVGDAYTGYGAALPRSDWVGPKTYAATKDGERLVKWRDYERKLLQDRARLERLVPELYGRTLVCWCPLRRGTVEDRYCHARVLAKYTNALATGRACLRPLARLFFK